MFHFQLRNTIVKQHFVSRVIYRKNYCNVVLCSRICFVMFMHFHCFEQQNCFTEAILVVVILFWFVFSYTYRCNVLHLKYVMSTTSIKHRPPSDLCSVYQAMHKHFPINSIKGMTLTSMIVFTVSSEVYRGEL